MQRCTMPLTVSRLGQARQHIIGRKLGKVGDDIVNAHAISQPLQNVLHCDAQTANAGLPAAFARLQPDDRVVVDHDAVLCQSSIGSEYGISNLRRNP
jgi:hypothetical protein